ncbi:unnamed protein product [Adineta steineri]|uniref:Glyoxalase-like domain-containing protein n=1 Tax=Adineta steineri TaxID=433720 RepID=A0A813VVA3_9BILA|nr:unnamed protein product [Adineta steineri]CAF3713517.1 unnamed protein product [Adineta steineri]
MDHIDHIVINTQDRIDEAVAFFERMGFFVTPRGYHSVGSINHTIIFKTDGLELLGYPAGKSLEQLPEFVQGPAGLASMALQVDNSDQMRDALMARGLTPQPILDLSRPLDLGNGKMADVKFRLITLKPDSIPGSNVSYCQHITPELIWRPEWQTHANGCIGMTQLSINVKDPKAAAELYLRAMDVVKLENTEANTCIIHLSNFQITLVHETNKPLGMFKLVFGTDSLEKDSQRFVKSFGNEAAAGVPFKRLL